MTFVGTATIFFAIVNLMKIVPYFMLGQFYSKNLATSVVLLPLAILANFAGIWLVKHMPTKLLLSDLLRAPARGVARPAVARPVGSFLRPTQLEHRQAARFPATRKRLVDHCNILFAQIDFSGPRVIGRMSRR